MASAAALMKKMDLNGPKVGAVAVLADGALGFVTSFAIGQVYHRWGTVDNPKWAAKNVARLAAGIGKLSAVLLFAKAGHPTVLGGLMNTVGQAGLNAIGLEMGLNHARKATGKKAAIVPADFNVKSVPGASEYTQIGALGTVAPGRGMSWDQVEELAHGH
jgi:hypothetical protein